MSNYSKLSDLNNSGSLTTCAPTIPARKAAMRYESSQAVCATCARFVGRRTYIRNGETNTTRPFCREGKFYVSPFARCDEWTREKPQS